MKKIKRLYCWFCGCNNDYDEDFEVVKDQFCQWVDACAHCARNGAEKVTEDGTVWMRAGYNPRG